MKCISLWQPWASAIALGSKRVETRSWPTNHRGQLAIHAAKRFDYQEMLYVRNCGEWHGALYPLLEAFPGHLEAPGAVLPTREALRDLLPLGAIVAVAELIDCRRTESFPQYQISGRRRPGGVPGDLYAWCEDQMGDFSRGRFGWQLHNVRALVKPIPYRGRQGLFDVPDDLLSNVELIRRPAVA